MIEMHALSRRYGDVLAVDDVTCRIDQGEIVGLLGHNGAGKTTIMKMLTGYLEPDAGSITVNNHSMTADRRAIQRQLGYLAENCPVYPDMTVVGYLAFRADMMGMAASAQPSAVRDALRRTRLEDRATDAIGTLSRGLRQRVGVAQAILHRPGIVILDEPTNGLDPEQIEHMRTLIKGLAEHATVIVSTHILSEVEAVCERVLMMRKGRLVLDARLADLNRARSLLLEVAEADASLPQVLAGIEGVTAITDVEPGTVRMGITDAWQSVAAAVARSVHEHGLTLYRLMPEVRSLEAIFREVNEKARQEVAHA